MTYRILLAYPGGEVLLHSYKRAMPIHDVTRKAASIASTLFSSWSWSQDGDIPDIETLTSAMVLIVSGPSGNECAL